MAADAEDPGGHSHVECNLRDMSSVHHLVEVARPDRVIHLAAQSFVGTSWQAPAETFITNTVSQMNLLVAVRARSIGGAKALLT